MSASFFVLASCAFAAASARKRFVSSVLIFRQIAFRIERRLTALRRDERDLRTRILQQINGAASSSNQKPVFFPVLPSWSSGGKNEEDFHIGCWFCFVESQ